jgi:hypothetical protein
LGVNDENFDVKETGAKWFTSNIPDRKQKPQQNHMMRLNISTHLQYREARNLRVNPIVCF